MTTNLQEKMEELAEEHFHRYHGDKEMYEGWESDDFKAGFTACYELMQEREKKLVEALKFYADLAIKDDDMHNNDGGAIIKMKRSIMAIDNGKRASQTLREIGEE